MDGDKSILVQQQACGKPQTDKSKLFSFLAIINGWEPITTVSCRVLGAYFIAECTSLIWSLRFECDDESYLIYPAVLEKFRESEIDWFQTRHSITFRDVTKSPLIEQLMHYAQSRFMCTGDQESMTPTYRRATPLQPCFIYLNNDLIEFWWMVWII